jgi:glycosyltransferase involved in cell wall biosynthesis
VAARAVWSRPATRSLGEVVDRVRPDLVHVHNTFPLLSPAVYRAASSRGVPVVQTVQNYRMSCAIASFQRDGRSCHDCVGRRVPLPAVRHACYHESRLESGVVAAMQVTHRLTGSWDRHVDLFLPVSDHVRARLVSAGAIQEDRSMVRRNHLSPDPGGRPEGSDGGYVAFTGRLSVEKGVGTLLDAAAAVPDVEVRIAGDGPLRPELEERARRLELRNVTFLGHVPRDDALTLVRGARCVAFPSTWEEPMSLALVEALALGVPVVATTAGGNPEAIDETTGLLVPPGDAEALAAGLRAAMDAPEEWQERGRAARRRFEERFSAGRAYEQLRVAYDRVGVTLD